MRQRNSPSFDIDVIDIDGQIVPGHSGGPIIYRNIIIGIGNGGIGGGTLPYTWGIPIDAIKLVPFTNELRFSHQYIILSKNIEYLFGSAVEESRRIIKLEANHVLVDNKYIIRYEIFFDQPIEKDEPVNAEIIIHGHPTNNSNPISYKSTISLMDGNIFRGKIDIPQKLPSGIYDFLLFTGKNEYITEFVVN